MSEGDYLKNKYLALLILLVVMMGIGCAESQNKATDSPTQLAPSTSSAANVTPIETKTYEDDLWLSNHQKVCQNLLLDFFNFGNAVSSEDLESMYYHAMHAKEDLHGAREADPLYNVSPKYAYARSEWINSLEDNEKAMDLYIACINEGSVDTPKMDDATDLINQGSNHTDNCTKAILAASFAD